MATLTEPRSYLTTIRIPAKDRPELQRRAREHEMSLTQLLVDAALGRLPEHTVGEIASLRERVERIEQTLYGT